MFYTVEELAALGVEAHPSARITHGAMFFGVGRIAIGEHARVDTGCILTGDIEIGRRVHIAPYCVLYGKYGIRMGDYATMSLMSVIHSEADDYSGRSLIGPQVPEECRPFVHRAAVNIGRCVGIGGKVTVLPGVTLRDGCVVAAHSLVKDDCEEDWIYGGTPARKLKQREKDLWHLVRNLELGLDA